MKKWQSPERRSHGAGKFDTGAQSASEHRTEPGRGQPHPARGLTVSGQPLGGQG